MIDAKEVLEYIEANSNLKADFEYLVNQISKVTNLKGGHDGSRNLADIINFNDKLALITTFMDIAEEHGTLSKYAVVNWINYNLFNITLISKLCEKLSGQNISNHQIDIIGPKYAVAYVWFAEGNLASSFVMWGGDKQTAWEQRVRFILSFKDYSYPAGKTMSENLRKNFKFTAISAKTNHRLTVDAAWSDKLFDMIKFSIDKTSK